MQDDIRLARNVFAGCIEHIGEVVIKVGSQDLLNEVQKLGQFGQHPSIAKLYGYCVHEERVFLVEQRYFRSVDRMLGARWAFSAEARIHCLLHTAAGLRYLHGSSPFLLHRDLKPANYFIDESERAVIGDFEFAVSSYRDAVSFDADTASGTSEYADPQYAATYVFRKSSDAGALVHFLLHAS